MERTREGWYEREELKKVTNDWVKSNCKLTKREMELIELIYERKLVRRDHLEIISPSYRNLTNRTSLINRAIKKMYKKMILDKVHEVQILGKGSNPSIVAIDKAGAILLDSPFKRRIIHSKNKFKGDEVLSRRLPANYRHINGVNDIEVKTTLLCNELDYEIILWELEKTKTFLHNDIEITLIPDVLVVIKLDDIHLALFIEYDTGSEGLREKEPKIIEDKIIKYKRYKSSLLWEKEEWQRYFKTPIFPMVLFVTEDEKRIGFVNRKSKELDIQFLAVYSDTYLNVLQKLIKIVSKESV